MPILAGSSLNDYYPFGMVMPGRIYGSAHGYRYGFNTQEKSLELSPNGNSNTAEFWQYDGRLGRRWNPDPIVSVYESRYAVNSNNPIWACDPKGDFDTRKEARQYRKDHNLKGRIRIMQDGYYSIVDKESRTLWTKNHDDQKVYESVIAISKSSSTKQKNMTPVDIGKEWLSGSGRKSRDFKNGDVTVELYKRHDFYRNAIEETKNILKGWQTDQALPEKSFPYKLSGLEGIGKYIRDYSTLLTAGQTGNLMFTYLGSHNLYMTVTNIDVQKRIATVEFVVHNTSTLESATRLPYFGYKKWYMNTIGEFINNAAGRTGPTSETEQVFTMEEKINF